MSAFRTLFLRTILISLSFFTALSWPEGALAAQIRLAWVDHSTNEDGFQIERKTGTADTFTQFATVAANLSSYLDSNVATGTTYCYRVRAFNTHEESAFSNEVCLTIAAPPVDTDGDGLTDDDELNLYGTDPTKADTDGDGFSDGEEVQAGADPSDPSSPPAPPSGLDSFKCYRAITAKEEPKFQPFEVLLEDQFESKPTRVLRPAALCSPVAIDGHPSLDPSAHLACYQIKDGPGQSEVERQDVGVANQFGTETLTITRSTTLCVPAEQEGIPSDLNLDPLKCYRAITAEEEPKFQPFEVLLEDQFESKPTRVLRPAALCSPVAIDGHPSLDPSAHLACYQIKDGPGQSEVERQDVGVANQFGTETLTITRSTTLCVPAEITPMD